MEEMNYSARTVMHLTLFLLVKFVSGGVHSLLYANQSLQISLLLALQVIMLGLIIFNRNLYLKKSLYCLGLFESLFRVSVNAVLLCEVLQPNFTPIVELCSISELFCEILMALSVVITLLGIIPFELGV